MDNRGQNQNGLWIPPEIDELARYERPKWQEFMHQAREEGPVAARQYFRELQEPVPLADLANIAGTAEADLLAAATWTPIAANQPRAGQLWSLTAWGVMTTSTTPGNITVTPRYGTSTGGTSLGASTAVALTASLTGLPWFLKSYMTIRSVGAAGSAVCVGTLETQVAARDIVFGGTTASINTTAAGGLFMGLTLGAASVTMTTKGIAFETLN